MNKLGIIVPYRARDKQLLIFKRAISNYLNDKNIPFELIIVEQDKARLFNRGKLLNVGFVYAKKLKCDYVVFHDVDMIPIDVDYSASNFPVQLSTNFISPDKSFNRILFDEYFGGVTIFPIDIFEMINGYSNQFWGWGYEDNDLLHRCRQYNVELFEKKIEQKVSNSAALKLNGHNAYIKGKNFFEENTSYTILISFEPKDINCNVEKYDDTFAVFSIPGMDFCINFNSYSRYNFEIYDEKEDIVYINSDIKPNYKTIICVTIDVPNKEIKMFQDGKLVGTKKYEGNLLDYSSQRYFYLGAGDVIRRTERKYFDGCISNFAVYSNVLNENEIVELSNNKHFGLTQNFGEYTSANNLKVCYDTRFIKDYKLMDLSGNDNVGKIFNCEIVPYEFNETKTLTIPHRRDCTFELLPHEENGYVNGAWKDITTRYNQVRYFNEVVRGHKQTKEDGLSNLDYKQQNKTTIGNQTHIVVEI
jgi:hypothetical protein